MNKNIIIGLLAVAVVVSAVFWFTRPDSITKIIERDGIGAVASPNISSPWFSYGNVKHRAQHRPSLTTASTTLCALQGPAATSTLETAKINIATGSTSALFIEIGYSTTKNATTTALAKLSLGANALATLVATNTVALLTDGIFAPNAWINVNVGGALAGDVTNLAMTGTCNATWQEI